MKHIFLIFTCCSLITSTTDAASLLHNWTFDSSNANDSVGSANGVATGTGVTYTISSGGQFGEALSVSGSGGLVMSYGGAFLPQATDFTYTAWFQDASGTDGQYFILGDMEAANNGFSIRVETEGADGDLWVRINGHDGTATDSILESGTLDGNWTHVALTVSSTEGSTLYLNGVAIPALSDATATTNTINTGAEFRIGYSLTDTLGFEGLIDDVAIFDGVLTTTELNNVISSGAANFSIPEPSSIMLCSIGIMLLMRRRRCDP